MNQSLKARLPHLPAMQEVIDVLAAVLPVGHVITSSQDGTEAVVRWDAGTGEVIASITMHIDTGEVTVRATQVGTDEWQDMPVDQILALA